MIVYRPHRGSLDRSMQGIVEFTDENKMKQYIVQEWNDLWGNVIEIDDIIISEPLYNDTRISWNDVCYVLIKRLGNLIYDTPQCIGYCSKNYKRNDENAKR